MKNSGILQSKFIKRAVKEAVLKLNPFTIWRNPVMLAVELCAIVTIFETVRSALKNEPFSFALHIAIWLIFTVLFANFAEALAEIQGKARADDLRGSRESLRAQIIDENGDVRIVSALELKKGDMVLVVNDAGKQNSARLPQAENDDSYSMIPGDGEIVEGTALVDESAITGESAPVIRESGGDRTGVTAGTKVLSGRIKIRITADPGNSFIDSVIDMVENAKRNKTPNEIALEILLIALTILFIIVVMTLPMISKYMGVTISLTVLISLLVCLMPTTIGGLLPAIGISGMDRLMRNNVIALSGRAVEAAGDVHFVLLDKTGTITLGNRMADEFTPSNGINRNELIEAAVLSSLSV
jgi:K+-transporting ATPase ATPase B chain